MILERVNRKILRTIQGLPVRCSSAALSTLLGLLDIATQLKKRQLSFIGSIANLSDDSIAKRVLGARMCDPSAKGITTSFRNVLGDLNLPDLPTSVSDPPKKATLKRFGKKYLAIISNLSFLSECERLSSE